MKQTFSEFPTIKSLTIKREAKLSTQYKPRFKNALSDKMSTYFKNMYLLLGFRSQSKKFILKTVIIIVYISDSLCETYHHQNVHQGPGRHFFLLPRRTTPVTYRITTLNKVKLMSRPNLPFI
jgi:hypothetical protein